MRAARGLVRAAALPLLWLVGAGAALAQQPLPVSKGVYRLPYADGTWVRFSNDHTNHPNVLNRVDMTGQGSGPFTVVAAAAGIIRVLVENNDTSCPNANNDPDGDNIVTAAENQQAQLAACGGYTGPASFCCERDLEANGGTCPGTPFMSLLGLVTPTCTNPNNHVWIEHPNGEWTKYTHLQRGSVGTTTDNNGNPGAGRSVGDSVDAGDPLGLQGDVGIASGPHLHFEVAFLDYVPNGTVADWFDNGGLLTADGTQEDLLVEPTDPDDDVNRQNRIPIFCNSGLSPAFCLFFPIACLGDSTLPAVDDDTWVATACDDACLASSSELDGTISAGSIFYRQVSDTLDNAGNDFVIEANAGAAIRAGNTVTLSPGFHAEVGSYFSASIGACDSPGGDD